VIRLYSVPCPRGSSSTDQIRLSRSMTNCNLLYICHVTHRRAFFSRNMRQSIFLSAKRQRIGLYEEQRTAVHSICKIYDPRTVYHHADRSVRIELLFGLSFAGELRNGDMTLQIYWHCSNDLRTGPHWIQRVPCTEMNIYHQD
jgi:hypothetical protein